MPLTCFKCLSTHQATCLAAQDSCSITVPVHVARRFHNFRLAPGTSVEDLENKIIAENIFEEFNGWDSLRPTKSLQHLEDILEQKLDKKKHIAPVMGQLDVVRFAF